VNQAEDLLCIDMCGFFGDREGLMKVSGLAIAMCFLLSLFCSGCSDEETSSPVMGRSKVVKAIVKPAAETPNPPPSVVEEKAEPEGKTDPGPKGQVMALKTQVSEQDKEPEKRGAAGPGYYVVKAGESLSSVAARDDVCGDSLKWVILLHLNMADLGKFPLEGDLPDRELPIGMRLKIPSPEEMKANMSKRTGRDWIINIKSSTAPEKIVPAAIALTKEGYPVYMTRVNVKGKDWVRLRLGFFTNRAAADAVGKEIGRVLNIADIWSSKAGKNEIAEFGGFWDQEKHS